MSAGVVGWPAEVRGQACPGQDLATHQAVVAFNSLTDGQPGAPRTLQLTVLPSYNLGERAFQSQFVLSGVPAKSGFACQAQLALSIPTLSVGEGLIDFEKSVTASWQQRWIVGTGKGPSFSTLISVQIPYDEAGAKTDATVTGILVQSTRWGALYLNAFAETTAGIRLDAITAGAVLGAKRIVRDNLALYADIAAYEGGTYALELSFERDFKGGLSVGPGISLSRSDGGSVQVAVGVVLFQVFGH